MRLPLVTVGLLALSVACAGENGAPSEEQAAQTPAASEQEQGLGLRFNGDTEISPDLNMISSDELKKVHAWLDENFEQEVRFYQRVIQQPSISNTGEGIPESAQMMKGYFDEIGCDSQVREPGTTEWGAPGNPVVYARCDVGAPRTLMIYMMYDTMPVTQPDLWKAPPFEARLMEQAPFPKVLIGRGATNSKGDNAVMISALRAIREVSGTLPVNLIIIAEGDEERMSIGLRQFVRDNPDLFEGAEAMLRTGGQSGSGRGDIGLGSSEGCVYIELTTSGAKWGRGPVYSDIHGGNKRSVDSPAWRHMIMLQGLIAPDTNTARVEGFYDNQEPLSPATIAALKEQAKNVNLEAAAKALGVARFISDDPYEYLRMARYGMSFNLDGIWGGNMYGGGAGAILPNKITSKHNVRYQPKQDGIDIVNKIRKQIDANGYQDVELKIIGDVPWHRGEEHINEDLINAIGKAFDIFQVPYSRPAPGTDTAQLQDAEPQWTIEPLNTSGGYWPAYLFGGDHNLPIHGGGLGDGGNAHAANEWFVIEGSGRVYGYNGAAKHFATVLYNYGGKN